MFLPATDDDVPAIVTLMNRAYRGTGAAGWSTQEPYLNGDRITEEVLRADLATNPRASLLKWEDPRAVRCWDACGSSRSTMTCGISAPWRPIRRGKTAGSARSCSRQPNNGCANAGVSASE